MSQLDRALGRLAERGDPIGSDRLLDRLERQLTSESVSGVVALETRRRDMETTPTTTKQPTPSWRGPRAALAAAAAIVVVGVATFAIASLISSDEPDALGSSQATATYVGDGCTYDGPTEFALNSVVTFTFINATANSKVEFSVWKAPEGTTLADFKTEGGLVGVVGEGAAADKRYDVQLPPTVQDREYPKTITLNRPGQHIVNCFTGLRFPDDLNYPILFTVSDG
jgi:hypothetical protein